MPLIEHLQQHVENVRMCLFNLVKQNHLIGSAAHCLGQTAPLFVADITGRRSDEACHRVFLHIFGHVDPQHRIIIVKQEFSQSLGKFGLANASRTQHQKTAHGLMRVGKASTGSTNGIGNGRHSLTLANDALADDRLHAKQFLALTFQHLVNRNTGPAADHRCDMRCRDLFINQLGFGNRILGRGKFLLQRREGSVGEFSRHLEPALTLGNFKTMPLVLKLLLQSANLGHAGLDPVPCRCQLGRALFETCQLPSNRRKPFFRGFGVFLLKRRLFDFQLNDLPVSLVQIGRLAVGLDAQMARRLVHHIDCLVRQKPFGDITVREACRRNQRIIGNPYTMVQLIFLLQATQDENRILNAWLINKYRLEPARQRCILFHILSIFIQRRCADTAQFATCQSRFQQV